MRAADVLGLLEGLGRSSEEIADSLRASGIKGKSGDPDSCPIACLLSARGARGVRVHEDVIYLPSGGHLDLPVPVQAFVADFDIGEYPELEEQDGDR